MKLSVIIPAFNEEKRIGSCLRHLSIAFGSLPSNDSVNSLTRSSDIISPSGGEGRGEPPSRSMGKEVEEQTRPSPDSVAHEIIVVDNNSTDRTAEIARAAGAQVIFEPVNQIARARNAGTAAATGNWLVFLDADTLVSPGTIAEMLDLIRSGKYAGGGTRLRYDRTPPFWRGFLLVSNYLVTPLLGWTPGCFLFCRADAFRQFGGFNQEMFAGEDVAFGEAMRRWAKARGLKTVLLRRHPPVTSIRKIELYGTREVFLLILRFVFLRHSTTRDKAHLRVFYDGRR